MKYLSLVFFGVGNFDARYFFGSKISGLCIILGLQYEAPSDPPVMYTSSTPPGKNIEDVLDKRFKCIVASVGGHCLSLEAGCRLQLSMLPLGATT